MLPTAILTTELMESTEDVDVHAHGSWEPPFTLVPSISVCYVAPCLAPVSDPVPDTGTLMDACRNVMGSVC